MDTTLYVQREQEARARLETEARALLDTAAAEGRELDAAEDERFEKLLADSQNRAERIKSLKRFAFATDDPALRAITGPAGSRDELRTMIQAGETERSFAFPTGDEFRAIDTTSSAQSTADFGSYFASYLRTEVPWLGLGTIWRARDGRDGIIGRITSDPTSYSPGQGTAITESTPTFDDSTITLTKYGVLSYVSNESVADAEFNISQKVAEHAARAVSQAFGDALTDTVASGLNAIGTATGTPFFALDDMISAKYAIGAPYRTNASWVLSNSAVAKVAKFRDTDGQYLWQPSNQVGQPDTLLGAPVYEDPYAPAVGSAVANAVIYGDIARALVIKMTDVQVMYSPHYRLAQDQLAIRVTFRAGGAIVDTAAAGELLCGNS